MAKGRFIGYQMEVLLFDRRDVIETSSFEGGVDVFYDENGKPIYSLSGNGNSDLSPDAAMKKRKERRTQ